MLPFWTLAVPLPGFLGHSSSAEPAVLTNAMEGVPTNFAEPESAIHGKSPATLLIPHSSLAESRSLLGAFNELTIWSWLLLLWILAVLGQVVRLLHQRLLLGCLLPGAEKETNTTILQQLSTLAGRLNLRRVP